MTGDAREVMSDAVEEALATRCITGENHGDGGCDCPDDGQLAVIFDAILAAFPNLTLPRTVSTVEEAREYMACEGRTQAAFLIADGSHVLFKIDADGDIGMVSPEHYTSFRLLGRNPVGVFPATVLHEGGAR